MEAWGLAQLGHVAVWAEDFERGLAFAEQAIALAESAGAEGALALGLYVVGHLEAITGRARLDRASELFARALVLNRTAGDLAGESLVRWWQGVVKNWQGAFREAYELGTDGLRMARERNLVVPLLRHMWLQAMALTGTGDYDDACRVLEEGLALAERIGDRALVPRYLNTLGWVHIECGDVDRGLEWSRLAVEAARKRRHAVGVEQTAYAEINRGDALLARGDLYAAREVLGQARELVKDASVYDWVRWRSAIHCFVSLGELALMEQDPDRAIALADESLRIATRTGARKYIARASRLKGDAATVRGRWDDAERALRAALDIAVAIADPSQQWKTQAALGRLHDARTNPEAARHAWQAARQTVDRLLAQVRRPQLRAGLEGTQAVRHIYQRSG